MSRSHAPLELSADQLSQLQRWIVAHGTPQQVVLRCRIVLLASQGQSDLAIASTLNINRKTVLVWRQRFQRQGLAGLWKVAPGRGRKARYSPAQVKAVVNTTLHSKPKGSTHWSCRTLARQQGMGKSTIHTILQSHNLKPHRVKTFKLSRDAKFLEKLTDVVGIYLNPPEKAVVLCVDEKSQIQALDRTQPGLPLKKGRCGTRTHDYKRYGTTSLFAALELLEGKVIGGCYQRHRHQEFLSFLRRIGESFPGDQPLHLVLDNYGTHNHGNVQAWLRRHPRFVLHFVPTSCSWLNLIERWFAELTQKNLRRGSFRSVPDLMAAIQEFLSVWNESPKPFVWTATVDSILAKLSGCRQTLEQIQPGCTLPPRRRPKSCPVN